MSLDTEINRGRAERKRLQNARPTLVLRAKMMSAIRDYLGEKDFLEIETPLRIPAPALEDYIDAEPAGDHWLRTSPELHMKRLLAANYPKIFQIGPCFRMGECGNRHLPEFTMLEWYSLQANYRDLLTDTIGLVRHVLSQTLAQQCCEFRGDQIDFSKDWEEITVDAAFARYTDTDVDTAIEQGKFEEILVEFIEPNLGHGRPTVFIDYPLACSGLSRAIPGQPNRVERWELYVSGLELANACSELIDLEEQQSRFAECRQLRASENRPIYPNDQPFLDALAASLPPCAGIAVGLDRLLMILGNTDSIQETVAFPAG